MRGDPVQPGVPGHQITVPPMAGVPPYCSCGVVGGTGLPGGKPLLADHIAEIKAAHGKARA